MIISYNNKKFKKMIVALSENPTPTIKKFFKETKKQDANKCSSQDTKQVNSVPCYTLISNFNFFQLFLIGNANQAFSNRLLAQQTLTRYDKENVANESFNLNNYLNNQSIVDHKELFINLLSEHIGAENENQDDENNNQDDEDFQNGKKLGKKEDEFYDRKDFIKKLKEYQDVIAFSRKIRFIQLDKIEESNIPDKILKKLSKLTSFSRPILFYTTKEVSSSIDFPLKVLIKQNYDVIKCKKKLIDFAKKHEIFEGEEEKHINKYAKYFNEHVSELNNTYIQLSSIIGTKNGVPILIIFDGNKMYKIYDNKSEQISNYDEFSTSIDQIYIWYYFINGLDASIQLKNSSILRSKLMHGRISDTDDILKGYIKYKLDNSWSNKEFNFIELIKESVTYPAFFGLCSKKTLLTSFHGSVILGTDKFSESSIISSFDANEKQEVNEFTQTYGTFTAFVLTLPKFLEAVKELQKSQDDESVSSLVKYLFGSVAAHNEILFDMFVIFLIRIINSKYLRNFGRCQKSFRQYLSMTVSNKEDLGFPKENYQNPTFNSVFNLSQRQGENSNSITAAQKLDDVLNNEDYKQFFDAKVKIEFDNLDDVDNSRIKYEPKFTKVQTYKDFLAKEFLFPEIHP